MVSSSPCLSPIGAKLTPFYNSKSASGRMELVILSQPEEQHRARYLTEGSRGAIKDITGMGHPVVKLNGYYSRQPIKLECYIGHDKHNGLPHLFYQASKISGKNSTQCTASKVEGTSVIVMNLLPEHDMQATIDCVGILKERNVDVEQKLLNLNHASKVLDFQEHAYQSAFTSITSQQQQPLSLSAPQPLLYPHSQLQQSSPTAVQPSAQMHLHQQQQQQQTTRSALELAKVFERAHQHHQHSSALHPLQHHLHHLDENSIDVKSRADSLDDSNDMASRHSFITDSNTQTSNSPTTTLVSDATTNTNNIIMTNTSKGLISSNHNNNNTVPPSAMQNGNLVTLNSRKRSVRCRLVFRVKIPETGEILQTISNPIICTQPLGTPEICKKSCAKAPVVANSLELFIIGKNFLKDSKIVFRNKENDWLKVVEPDKEFLNSSHLICKVPDYDGPELTSGVDLIEVELLIKSGGKFSEPHSFVYLKTVTENVIQVPQIRFEPQPTQPQPQQQQLTAAQLLPQIHQQQQQVQQQQQQQQVQQQQQQYQPELQQQQQTQQTQFEQQQQTIQEQQIQQQIVIQQQQQQLHQQQYQQTEQTQQFDNQPQQTLQDQQQQQQIQQLALQQQQQQQQIQANQILTTLDLNDDSTVIYADSLQATSGLVHNVVQGSTLMGNIDFLNEDTCMSVTNSIIQAASISQISPTVNGQSQLGGQLVESCVAQHQLSFAQHQQLQQNQTFF